MLNAFKAHSAPKSSVLVATKVDKEPSREIETLPFGYEQNEAHIFWYVGSHGLKKDAIDFYRDPIKNRLNAGAQVYLYDMTAWGAFENPKCGIDKANKNSSICERGLSFIPSSDVLMKIKKLNDDPFFAKMVEDFIGIDSLWAVSDDFKERGIKLNEIFGELPVCLQKIAEVDVAKCYALFQYIELFCIVEHVLFNNAGKDKMSINFNLPNDEAKYYPDRMRKDLRDFIAKRHSEFSAVAVNINLFRYGSQSFDRPYNAGKKVVKSHVTMEDISGISSAPKLKKGK